jgi:hypothetical protein
VSRLFVVLWVAWLALLGVALIALAGEPAWVRFGVLAVDTSIGGGALLVRRRDARIAARAERYAAPSTPSQRR